MHTPLDEIIPVTIEKRGNRIVRKGMCRAAQDLGVTLTHLFRHLRGERPSARLHALIEEKHPELLSDEMRNPSLYTQPQN